jgi:autotransporter-associated beta strand protein
VEYPYVNAAAAGQVVGDVTIGSDSSAVVWSEPSGSPIYLNPTNIPGSNSSLANNTDGTQQVGTSGGNAILWSGTAASAIDLNPTGCNISAASAISGSQEVGYGWGPATNNQPHAMLWSGTAASAVDLNPPGFMYSYAYGVGGGEQVGTGVGPDNNTYALLWHGTARSAVDLTPTGVTGVRVFSTNGSQQVGYCGISSGNEVAYLWSGTAASAIDLSPTDLTGFPTSLALGNNSIQQVGEGAASEDLLYGTHALLWYGTAASAVDLHLLLPTTGNWLNSVAYSIDAAGNVYGTAEGSFDEVSSAFAVEWSPVPSTLTWNSSGGTGDGATWDVSTSQNWNKSSPSVFNQYDNVTFNDANNGNYNVTLNTLVAPTSVTFANKKGNYVLSGSGGIGGAASLSVTGSQMVTISTSNSYSGPTSVTGGTLVIAAANALPSGTALTIGNGATPAVMQLAAGIGPVAVSSLTINPGGVLDLTNNALAINFSSPANDPAATIRAYLQTGYNGGTWTGPGIDSSSAAVNPGLYSVGYADGNTEVGTPAAANQILIQYTLAGDANLDGVVNFPDLLLVAQNYGKTGQDWAQGDFNYDGVVNFPDLLIVAQNYGNQLSDGQLAEFPNSFAAQWQLAEAEIHNNNVPEPASSDLFVAVTCGLLACRRRGHREDIGTRCKYLS